MILDGEIVALRGGRPDFGALQSRMHVRRPPARLTGETPVQLYLFDLLHHGPASLPGLPCTGRRDRLEALGLDADPVRTPPWYRDDADIVLAASLEHGLEGVVGKPLASRYHPGGRRDWIKVKNIRHQEVIIGGWNHGEGGRAHTIGSLLLGVWGLRSPDEESNGYASDLRLGRNFHREVDHFRYVLPGLFRRGARRQVEARAAKSAWACSMASGYAWVLSCTARAR